MKFEGKLYQLNRTMDDNNIPIIEILVSEKVWDCLDKLDKSNMKFRLEQIPTDAPLSESTDKGDSVAKGEPNWDKCTCPRHLGMGPSLKCPVHGREP